MFRLFNRKKKHAEDKRYEEFMILKQETDQEVARIKAEKSAKVALEIEELIRFRRIIKKYGADGIYFLAFGGVEPKGDSK